jgi:hypothetical protein
MYANRASLVTRKRSASPALVVGCFQVTRHQYASDDAKHSLAAFVHRHHSTNTLALSHLVHIARLRRDLIIG